jgi:hypothetical protein
MIKATMIKTTMIKTTMINSAARWRYCHACDHLPMELCDECRDINLWHTIINKGIII